MIAMTERDWVPVSSFTVAKGDVVRVPSGSSIGSSFTADFIEGRVEDVADARRILLDVQGSRVVVDGTRDTRWLKLSAVNHRAEQGAIERAEGFWWVRVSDRATKGEWAVKPTGWTVCRVLSGGNLMCVLDGVEGQMEIATWDGWVWGPYLGKAPDGDVRVKTLQAIVGEALKVLPPGDGTVGTEGLLGRLRMLGYPQEKTP